MGLAAALLEAAARGDAARLASVLHADSSDINVTDENGCSALQRAAADGHVEVVKLLLQHGADPNKQDLVHGNTAAHEAGWKGYSRCVAELATGGADLRVRNAGGFVPLHLACQNGHNQSCREILLANAPPDLQNNYGDTSLHTAARYGHAGVTRILISAQCRVSEQNKNGDTALHIAAAMGRRKLTRILLEAGCDKSIKNHQNETARDIATRKGLSEIINILNTPVAKQTKKKDKHRDKSKERTADGPDAGKQKNKDKKKKNVHFETTPPAQWSPYGCHYYPDPKYFPKPKLSSLPTEPLQKGEQYYLDLAGNIKKGPIGAGYTCYCAPFFKHMEEKLNEDKKDLKRHIDKAHDRLDQKVTDLEMKTQGQISELTRFVAAERAMCKERHNHLEQWLTRGMLFRASERVRRLDYSPKGSLDIAPIKRTRSLEILDAHSEEWNKVHKIIRNFNENSDHFESDGKILNESKATSKSTEILDTRKSPQSPRRKYHLKNSKSSDQLDAGSNNFSRLPQSYTSPEENHLQNVIAEIHVKSNRISVSQSPVSMEVQGYSDRYVSPSRQSNTKSPSSSNRQSDYRATDSEGDNIIRGNRKDTSPTKVPSWKSQVLQRTADDIRKRVILEKEMSEILSRSNVKSMDISQDGYVKLHKQDNYPVKDENVAESEPRKSVQELVAQVEHQHRCISPDPTPMPRKMLPIEIQNCNKASASPVTVQPSHGILKMPQQPQRPAPILKEKPPKSKRFSLQNLIPFPTRKTFQTPHKESENNSESSDEEDNPIRSKNQPGPMRNSNLLQTLPLPNYEAVSTKSQSPAPQVQSRPTIPKDAYFHDIPNRQTQHQMPYKDLVESGLPVPQYTCQNSYDYNETGLPQPQVQGRNRNPLYHHQTGVFDAMMQDHIIREMERIPHCYSDHLDQNTEVEIANENDHFRGNYYDNRPPMYPHLRGNAHAIRKPVPDHNLLHSRLQSLAINTHLTEIQSQADRESHNDSGYSTKVYGSSQGPSPSLSGHVECADNISGQRVNVMPNGKPLGQIGASSLV